MRDNYEEPWYRQFWPWFIIAIPLSSVIAGIAMIIVAIDGADDMVIDDYYKEGLSINKRLKKLGMAKSLGISANIILIEQKVEVVLLYNSVEKTPKLESKGEILGEPLKLKFHHATIEERDFQLMLQETRRGHYFATLTPEQLQSINAKWHLQLSPFSENWQLAGSWILPSSEHLRLGL
jgi:uncharacterized protein